MFYYFIYIYKLNELVIVEWSNGGRREAKNIGHSDPNGGDDAAATTIRVLLIYIHKLFLFTLFEF